jgi:phosphoribosyl 1,2-cyclic phosphodiesterase
MRFASLGSGSEGNGLIVESGDTRLLVDCGFTLSETVMRLGRLGLEPEHITALLVTHEHEDHAGGVFRFGRRFDIPVYLTYGTLVSLTACRAPAADKGNADAGPIFPLFADEPRRKYKANPAPLPPISLIDMHTPFAIGDVEVHPYPVPHDAREPSQFVFSDGDLRLGLLTDTGDSTPHIERMLSGLDALILECNHDIELLMNGAYPPQLKRRISGRYGHLDNATAARILKGIDCSRLQHFIAAHLSAQNNTPELARAAACAALGCEPSWIGIASQAEGLGWRQIS